MNNYFTNHYAVQNNIYKASDESIRSWYEDILKYYEREFGSLLSNINDCNILEIGCGIGGFLNYLNSKGTKNFIGVDNSKEQLDICRKYSTSNVVHSDAIEYLKNNDKKFDIIILIDFVEHVEKKEIMVFFNLLFNSLNNGGKIILRTPNMGSLTAIYSRYIDFTHEIGFSEDSISQVLKEVGFNRIIYLNNRLASWKKYTVKYLHKLIFNLHQLKVPKIYSPNIIVQAEK